MIYFGQRIFHQLEVFFRTAKAMWDKDYDFSQSQYNDITQMFILQNALGIQNVIRKLGSMYLPEKP